MFRIKAFLSALLINNLSNQKIPRRELPSTFLLVLLDQRFAIDPCLPSLVICMMRATGRQPALVAGATPAAIWTAGPDEAWPAPAPEAAASGLFDGCRVLDLGVEVRGARHLGGVGRNSHRSQHESRCRQRHSEFSHKTLLHVCWDCRIEQDCYRRATTNRPLPIPRR